MRMIIVTNYFYNLTLFNANKLIISFLFRKFAYN